MIDSGEHRGRTAVVAGESGAIGRALAGRLLSEGTKVFFLDPKAEANSSRGDGIPDALPMTSLRVDISREADVDRAFETVARDQGRIDYLVYCASTFSQRAFLDLDPEEWKNTLDANLSGAFLCCRSALRHMRGKKFGRIVLFSSMLARTGGVNGAHYAAATGGILGLARTLALEVAHENIRVNTVSPGLVEVSPTCPSDSAAGSQIPLGRTARLEDIVEACLFLLNDESSYFTGQDIRVNGGTPLW
jgi:NAD(P)-dependent dehydrogenase (short-subunit alcohol dehydrogenase family)